MVSREGRREDTSNLGGGGFSEECRALFDQFFAYIRLPISFPLSFTAILLVLVPHIPFLQSSESYVLKPIVLRVGRPPTFSTPRRVHSPPKNGSLPFNVTNLHICGSEIS
jgi:hypothetical protein